LDIPTLSKFVQTYVLSNFTFRTAFHRLAIPVKIWSNRILYYHVHTYHVKEQIFDKRLYWRVGRFNLKTILSLFLKSCIPTNACIRATWSMPRGIITCSPLSSIVTNPMPSGYRAKAELKREKERERERKREKERNMCGKSVLRDKSWTVIVPILYQCILILIDDQLNTTKRYL